MRRSMALHTRRFLARVARGWRIFTDARLRGADLRGACLDGLHLAGADMRRARLTGASLRGARLDGASLAHADLRDADVSGADLRDADMRGARLDGMTARGAWVTDDMLALLEDAPDTHTTGVIVSLGHVGGDVGEGGELITDGEPGASKNVEDGAGELTASHPRPDREQTETESEASTMDNRAILDEAMRRNVRVLDAMRSTRELSDAASSRLRRAMLAGEDAYPYYSLDGRAYVWSAGKRYTASAYNALAYGDEVGRFYPLALWRLDTPGFYYTDADGETWATFTSGERVTCALCGAGITHGYRTPDTVSEPARHVCASHVAAHPGETIRERETESEG